MCPCLQVQLFFVFRKIRISLYNSVDPLPPKDWVRKMDSIHRSPLLSNLCFIYSSCSSLRIILQSLGIHLIFPRAAQTTLSLSCFPGLFVSGHHLLANMILRVKFQFHPLSQTSVQISASQW
jgi:hypothetical protein